MPRPKGSKNKTTNKSKNKIMAEAPAASNNQNKNKNNRPSLAILSFGLSIGDETTCPVCKKRFILNEWELYRIGGIAGQTSSLIEGETGYACSWQCFLTYDMHHNNSGGDGELISAKAGRRAKKANKVVIESAPKTISLVTEPKPITNNNNDIEIDPAEIESLLDLVKRLTDT